MRENADGVIIRQLAAGDAARLAAFYNGLSERARRTFRPLGWTTSLETCAGIVLDQIKVVRKQFSCDHPADRPAVVYPHNKCDFVALCGAHIIGWSFVWNLNSDEPLFGLAIADAYQGRGLGSALMDHVLNAAQVLGIEKLELTVVQDNHLAWQMYERRGFKRYGEFVSEADGLAYYKMTLVFEHSRRHGPAD